MQEHRLPGNQQLHILPFKFDHNDDLDDKDEDDDDDDDVGDDEDGEAIKECAQACGARVFERGVMMMMIMMMKQSKSMLRLEGQGSSMMMMNFGPLEMFHLFRNSEEWVKKKKHK